jgi:hypothetical protein
MEVLWYNGRQKQEWDTENDANSCSTGIFFIFFLNFFFSVEQSLKPPKKRVYVSHFLILLNLVQSIVQWVTLVGRVTSHIITTACI